jgi:site-specific DNA-methyltransferase (adenine-specific)
MDAPARVLCGDAARHLRSLPQGCAALTVTSPPYYQHRDYGVAGQIGREPTLEGYLGRIGEVLTELLRVTDERGSCFVVLGDTWSRCRLLLVPHRVALLAAELGWTVRNDVIWAKSDPAPESPRNRWRAGHEHVLFLTRQPSGYRFNDDAVRVPHAPSTLRRWGNGQTYGGQKSKGRRKANDSRMRHGASYRLNPSGCLPTDVWQLPCAGTKAGHYAAFPPALVRPIIEACSNPGDLVLDPFAGTATTGVLALELGRRFLGIELNPEYVALARDALGLAEAQPLNAAARP